MFTNILKISIAFIHPHLEIPSINNFNSVTTAQAQPNPNSKSIRLLHILTGHNSPIFGINTLTITPDGRTLISGARDGKIILWNLQSGKRLREWIGDLEGVESTSIDRYGKMLVSGGIDRQVKVWSLPEGKLLFAINSHTAPVTQVMMAIDPQTNHQLFISISDDRTIQIWQPNSQKLVGTLNGITGYIADFLITPDRRYAIASERKGIGDNTQPKIRIWDWQQRQMARTISVPESGFSALAVTPDSKYLIGGSFGQLTGKKGEAINTLKLWNLATGKLSYEFPDNVDSIESLVVSKDGKLLVCGTFDGKIKIWNLTNRKLLTESNSYDKAIVKLTISDDRRTLVGGLEDGRILIWQLDVRG